MVANCKFIALEMSLVLLFIKVIAIARNIMENKVFVRLKVVTFDKTRQKIAGFSISMIKIYSEIGPGCFQSVYCLVGYGCIRRAKSKPTLQSGVCFGDLNQKHWSSVELFQVFLGLIYAWQHQYTTTIM